MAQYFADVCDQYYWINTKQNNNKKLTIMYGVHTTKNRNNEYTQIRGVKILTPCLEALASQLLSHDLSLL